MRKKLLATLMAAVMLATAGCSSMPGMGNTQTTAAADSQNSGDSTSGADDTVYELRISTSQTEQALITRNYQKLADTLNERSGGRLNVSVYPAGQLGTDEDVLEQGIQGVNVAVNTDASRLGQYVKDFSCLLYTSRCV